MSRFGLRARLLAFVVMTAIGLVYISSNFLGLTDRILGRNLTVQIALPESGGLFIGSQVTYRGVKVGEITDMEVADKGLMMTARLDQGTKIPSDSAMYVHNLSAVGEQYLDFEPADGKGPFVEDGDKLSGTDEALPVDEGELLVGLDRLVGSVDHDNLRTSISELGQLFADTGQPLQQLLDNGRLFLDEANANTQATQQLLDSGKTVLRTQQQQGRNVLALARDLRDVTGTLRTSDGDLRRILSRTPGATTEVNELLKDLEPTLPTLLANAITVGQVVVPHLDGVEQLLVTYPVLIYGGLFTPDDGYGHVNLQFDYSQPPCTNGYLPPDQWRSPRDLTDGKAFDASCKSGPPYVMRGPDHAPGQKYNPSRSSGASGASSTTGSQPYTLSQPVDLTSMGGDAWRWMLIGPTTT